MPWRKTKEAWAATKELKDLICQLKSDAAEKNKKLGALQRQWEAASAKQQEAKKEADSDRLVFTSMRKWRSKYAEALTFSTLTTDNSNI